MNCDKSEDSDQPSNRCPSRSKTGGECAERAGHYGNVHTDPKRQEEWVEDMQRSNEPKPTCEHGTPYPKACHPCFVESGMHEKQRTKEPKACASCGHQWTEDTLWCSACRERKERELVSQKTNEASATDIRERALGNLLNETLDLLEEVRPRSQRIHEVLRKHGRSTMAQTNEARKPIQSTPILYGEDAKEVLASLKKVAPREELDRRFAAAKRFEAMVSVDKVLQTKETSPPGLPYPSQYSLDDYKNAPSGIGPLANQWKDKPHRLIYDLVARLRTKDMPEDEFITRCADTWLARKHQGREQLVMLMKQIHDDGKAREFASRQCTSETETRSINQRCMECGVPPGVSCFNLVGSDRVNCSPHLHFSKRTKEAYLPPGSDLRQCNHVPVGHLKCPECLAPQTKEASPSNEDVLREEIADICNVLPPGGGLLPVRVARLVSERDSARLERDEYLRAYNGLIAIRAEQRTNIAPPVRYAVQPNECVDIQCFECGEMMTEHVLVTRHANSTCADSYSGPPLDMQRQKDLSPIDWDAKAQILADVLHGESRDALFRIAKKGLLYAYKEGLKRRSSDPLPVSVQADNAKVAHHFVAEHSLRMQLGDQRDIIASLETLLDEVFKAGARSTQKKNE
jgi:hypothetical protein